MGFEGGMFIESQIARCLSLPHEAHISLELYLSSMKLSTSDDVGRKEKTRSDVRIL